MRLLLIAAVSLIISAPFAHAQAQAPEGSTPEQQRLVLDWAKYSTACKGGALDGTQETAWGYCGTADYIMYRLSVEGICPAGSDQNWFARCKPGSIEDPFKDYPF